MRTLLTLTALLAAAAPARAETPVGVEILVLDDYGDDQLPPRHRSGWWALCPGDPVRLQAVKVSGRAVPNEVGPTTRVSAAPCGGAPLLVRARTGLAERDVPTATWTTTGQRARKVVHATLGSQTWSVRLVGAPEHAQWLELSGARTQRLSLAKEGGDWSADDWKLLWAGDLDGDGALDLAFRANGDGDVVELWLSSRARGAQLVGKAASTFLGGC